MVTIMKCNHHDKDWNHNERFIGFNNIILLVVVNPGPYAMDLHLVDLQMLH